MNIQQRIKVLQSLLTQEWFTVSEAQIYADRSESSLYRLIRNNKLVTNKNKAGRTLISRHSIDEWQGATV